MSQVFKSPEQAAQDARLGDFAAAAKAVAQQTNCQSIEEEIQAKGLTAPRVTPADIEANIADVEIVKHVTKSGKVLRWAVLTTRNGFAVVGKPSASVSVENDNEEIGAKVAISNSREELWPLMGYELQSQLADCAEQLKRRPNPAHGAPKPAGHNPVA